MKKLIILFILFYSGNVLALSNPPLCLDTSGQHLNYATATNAFSCGTTSGFPYPSAGIANSTGSAWGTSYTTSGTGTVLALTASPTFSGTITGGTFSGTHTGSGSGLTGIGTASLGGITGTPSSTTYLRGDGTWGTPTGSGGGGTVGSGTAGNVAYYQSSGTAVIGTSTMNIVNGSVAIGTNSNSFAGNNFTLNVSGNENVYSFPPFPVGTGTITYNNQTYSNVNVTGTPQGTALVDREDNAVFTGTGTGPVGGHIVGNKAEATFAMTGGHTDYAIGSEAGFTWDPSGTGSLNTAYASIAFENWGSTTHANVGTYAAYAATSAGNFLGTVTNHIDFWSQNIGNNGGGTMTNEYSLKNDDPNKIISSASATELQGNVQIGALSLSPRALQVLDTSGNGEYFSSTGANDQVLELDNSSTGQNSFVSFAINGAQKFNFGTLSPGTVFFFDIAHSASIIQSDTSGNTTWGEAGQLVLPNAGRVGIGTSSPSSALQVVGTITATGYSGLPVATTGAQGIMQVGSGLAVATGTVSSSAKSYLSYQPGLVTGIVNNKSAFSKISVASTVDNMIVSAQQFSCSGNPTITMYECGTSTTCASPTTIGTATPTAAATAFPATISNSAITAGDYVAFAVSAGTCVTLDVAAIAQIHAN